MNGDFAIHQQVIMVSNFLDQAAFVLSAHLPSDVLLLAKPLIAIVVVSVVKGALESFGIHRDSRLSGGASPSVYFRWRTATQA